MSYSYYLGVLEQQWLRCSHEFGQVFESSFADQESSEEVVTTRQRVGALCIPVICFISEALKGALNTVQAFEFGAEIIKNRRAQTGNIQTGIMHVSEHARNILGMTLGVPLAIAYPKTCSEVFLARRAKQMNRKLDMDDAAKLYALAYAVDAFFKKHSVDYRISGGTLLGAARHKGIIPWDDDVDVHLHPDSVQKCQELFEKSIFTKETGIEVKPQPHTGGWECFYSDSKKGEGPLEGIGLPFLDVFRTVFDKETQTIQYESKEMGMAYPGEYFTLQNWNDSKEYDFGPISMTGVKDYRECIDRSYGPDAMDFAYQTIHHEEFNKIFGQPLRVRENLKIISEYGLPRRTVLSDKSPIEYNKELYTKLIAEIDQRMKDADELSSDFTTTESDISTEEFAG